MKKKKILQLDTLQDKKGKNRNNTFTSQVFCKAKLKTAKHLPHIFFRASRSAFTHLD